MPIIIILLSFLMGLPFIVGLFLSKRLKSKFMTYFSTGLAFAIILAVLFTDIIPELLELSTTYSEVWATICGEAIGIISLIIIDLFIPHHHHDHVHNDDSKKDHKEHLYHIGILTFISVVIHNILEGIAFYLIAKTSIKAALLMAGGIALHNIPLGIEMSYFLSDKKDKHIRKYLALVISGTFGALIGLVIGDIYTLYNIIILSITCGMMLYIGFIELGTEVCTSIKEKGVIEGLLVGAIIFALMLL